MLVLQSIMCFNIGLLIIGFFVMRAVRGGRMREFLAELLNRSTKMTTIVVNSISDEIWTAQPDPSRFSPAGYLAHLVVTTQFFTQFFFPQVGVDTFELHPKLREMATLKGEELKRAINAGNLNSVQRLLAKTDRATLITMYAEARLVVADRLQRVAEHHFGDTVSHPIVKLTGSFPVMFWELFIDHNDRHLGQIVELVGLSGGKVPFYMGKLGE